MKRGDIVYLDTNAIAAAHRLNLLRAIKGGMELRTVSTCVDESTRPNRHGKRLVSGTIEDLRSVFSQVLEANDYLRANLARALPLGLMLDDGERDLLAVALPTAPETWWLCGPDRAMLRALISKGLAERMVSLEAVAAMVGQARADLPVQYTDRWLQVQRLRLLLA